MMNKLKNATEITENKNQKGLMGDYSGVQSPQGSRFGVKKQFNKKNSVSINMAQSPMIIENLENKNQRFKNIYHEVLPQIQTVRNNGFSGSALKSVKKNPNLSPDGK